MNSSPLFLKIRAIAFSLISLICLLWITLICVYLDVEWDLMDPSERPIIAVMLLTHMGTLIILLILLILPFRPWLDGARLILLLVAQIGVAGSFSFWDPRFHCPQNGVDSQGVCQLLNLYILLASWVVPVLLIGYAAGLGVMVCRRPKMDHNRGSILPIMNPALKHSSHISSTWTEKNRVSDLEHRKHISGLSTRTFNYNGLTKPSPALLL